MRAKTFGLGIVCGLLLAVMPFEFISYFRTVYPTPDTQSTFIKNYNPQPLIGRFVCGNRVAGTGGFTSSAGTGFVSHRRNIIAYIEIDERHLLPLMQALAADVDHQLIWSSETGAAADKNTTARFAYQDGRTLGSVTIPPLTAYDWISTQNNNYPRQPGCTPVVVSIYIDEVFIPKLPLDPVDHLSRITNRWDRN